MTSAGVAGMVFQCAFEGSLSMQDTKLSEGHTIRTALVLCTSLSGVLAPSLVKGTFPSQRNIHGVMVPCACRHHQLPNSPLLSSATCPCPLPHLQETESVNGELIIRPCHMDGRYGDTFQRPALIIQ